MAPMAGTRLVMETPTTRPKSRTPATRIATDHATINQWLETLAHRDWGPSVLSVEGRARLVRRCGDGPTAAVGTGVGRRQGCPSPTDLSLGTEVGFEVAVEAAATTTSRATLQLACRRRLLRLPRARLPRPLLRPAKGRRRWRGRPLAGAMVTVTYVIAVTNVGQILSYFKV